MSFILRSFEFELSEIAVIKLHLKFLTIRKQRRRSRTHTRFRERRIRKRAAKSFPVRCFPLPRLSIEDRGREGKVDYSPRETTRTANKGPRARYIMSSRTHKKTRLRNSNDIMFAPLFSRRKGATVDPGETERVGRWKKKRVSPTATRTRGGRVGGIEGKTRRQPGRS